MEAGRGGGGVGEFKADLLGGRPVMSVACEDMVRGGPSGIAAGMCMAGSIVGTDG